MQYSTGKRKIDLKKSVINASKKVITESGRVIQVAFGPDAGSKPSPVSISECD